MLRKYMCYILFLSCVQTASAQSYWSIGPKLGYTFGVDGGATLGLEISYLRGFPPEGVVMGYTLDITTWHKITTVHLGVEGPFIDVGPTLFFSKGNVDLGISAIPWFGAFLYPYYELAWPFHGQPFHSIGGYFKIPVWIPASTQPDWSVG